MLPELSPEQVCYPGDLSNIEVFREDLKTESQTYWFCFRAFPNFDASWFGHRGSEFQIFLFKTLSVLLDKSFEDEHWPCWLYRLNFPPNLASPFRSSSSSTLSKLIVIHDASRGDRPHRSVLLKTELSSGWYPQKIHRENITAFN